MSQQEITSSRWVTDMTSLARWCFRHRGWVLASWLVLLVILGVAGRAAGSAYSDSLTLPGTGSTAALNLLTKAFPGHAGDQDSIVWRVSTGSVRDHAVRARITAMLDKVAHAPSVAAVISPYSARGATQISRDGTIAYATVVFDAQARTCARRRSTESSTWLRRRGPPACRSISAGQRSRMPLGRR